MRSWFGAALAAAVFSAAIPSRSYAADIAFDLETATLQDVQKAMDAGALTSVQLVNLYLRRIALYDQTGAPFLNSVMFINPDALEQAAEADRQRAAGIKVGPLQGIPCLVKGSYAVEGLPQSGGTTAWAGLIAPANCFVVQKLRDAGAVILGQANMDTWANSGQSSTSQVKGAVKNAYVLGSTAGGSSGGSAAATAANFAFFAFGGETGASIKGPSDRNGVAGQRPTAGMISVNHIIALSPERDVIGPMARNVSDIAAIRDAVSFRDPDDGWAPVVDLFLDGKPFPTGFQNGLTGATLSGKKLGIVGTYVGMTNPDPGAGATTNTTSVMTTRPEIFALLEQSKAEMEAAGATVDYVFLPAAASTTYDRGADAPQRLLSTTPYSTQLAAFAHRGLVESLVRTPEDTADTLAAKVIATAAQPTNNSASRTISDTVISYMYTFDGDGHVTGDNVINYASAPAIEHYTALVEIRRQLEAFMDANGLDGLVFPVDSGKTATVGSVNGRDIINAMHIPGTVVPNGVLPDGEPTCLIFVGRGGDDVNMCNLAYAYEQISHRRVSTPLAPALPEESFTYAEKVTPTPVVPVAAPTVSVSSRLTIQGSGKKAKLVFKGHVGSATALSSFTVTVDGRRVAAAVKADGSWTAKVPASRYRNLAIGGGGKITVNAEAVNAQGGTGAKFSSVKLSSGKLLASL